MYSFHRRVEYTYVYCDNINPINCASFLKDYVLYAGYILFYPKFHIYSQY